MVVNGRPETLDEAIEAAIDRGLSWALQTYGPEELLRIDPDELDLASPLRCIVGRLERNTGGNADYSTGIERLKDAHREEVEEAWREGRDFPAQFGFECGEIAYDGEGVYGFADYKDLTDRWRERLRQLAAEGHREV